MVEYETYKDSGTAWLGHIPADWKISAIGSLYTMRNTKVSDADYLPLSVTMKGIVPQLENAAKTDAHDARKLVCKGDFAINSRSDRRGSCGISDYDGSVSLINTVLTPRGNMNPRYYNWLFHTVQFADEYYKNGRGIVEDLWTTRWNEMKRILIPVPSDKEQTIIADYLDTEIDRVDAIIAEAKASIDEYKAWKASIIYEVVTRGLDPNVEMKESGIEYIGKIPASWEIKKLRNIGTPQNGISKSGDSFGQGYPFVSYGDVYRNFSLPAVPSGLVSSTEEERLQYSVEEGDIFFTRTSETIEEVGFSCVCEETIPNATFAGFLIRVRPHTNDLLTGFAKYFFRSPHHRAYFAREMNLVTRASLSQGLLKSMPVVIPPKNEQKEIADFLDHKCAVVDALITEKQKLIADLEAYKKSLIFEVVTGKRKVV